MSCWVAPSLAAELWGISIEQVLQRTRSGEVACCEDYGFFLVDVAPESPAIDIGRSAAPPPATFVPISAEEMNALAGEPTDSTPPDSAPSSQPEDAPAHPQEDEGHDPPAPAVPFEEWRNVRRRMSRLRIPPRQRACDA